MSIVSVPLSDAKPTGEPSSVAISVSCSDEPLAEGGFVVGRRGPGLASAHRCNRPRVKLLDAGAEDFREQRHVRRQERAQRRSWDGAAPSSRDLPGACRPWCPSARCPWRRARRGCGRTSSKFFALRASSRADISYSILPLSTLALAFPDGCSKALQSPRKTASPAPATSPVLLCDCQRMQLGDRLRRIEIVAQRFEHRRRELFSPSPRASAAARS